MESATRVQILGVLFASNALGKGMNSKADLERQSVLEKKNSESKSAVLYLKMNSKADLERQSVLEKKNSESKSAVLYLKMTLCRILPVVEGLGVIEFLTPTRYQVGVAVCRYANGM